MTKRVLLYGATGFSGRLIAALMRTTLDDSSVPLEFVIGGRDERALAHISDELDLPYSAFALDEQPRVEAVLSTFDVVLNAAGPFAQTAPRLIRSAIATGCHYVDINGEVDVYQQLDDLGRPAATRGITIVSGAGFTSAVSDVLLDHALETLAASPAGPVDVGEIRIAISAMSDFSRGSLQTMLRSVREEVLVIRGDALAHVPVGRIERAFDFAPRKRPRDGIGGIASAVNLLDTLTAFRTLRRRRVSLSGGLTSFVEMPLLVRQLYQAGAFSAVLLQLPMVQQVARLQLAQLPEGPDAATREALGQTVLLQIDAATGEPVIDWRLETPNTYDVTAECALAVTAAVAQGGVDEGWITPAQVLSWPAGIGGDAGAPAGADAGPLDGCTLEQRQTVYAWAREAGR